ncbi:MAG: hypothetical protein RLZZ546_2949, partial [Bacteroidota bacterium]
MTTNAIKWLLLLLFWIGLFTYLCKRYICGSNLLTPIETSNSSTSNLSSLAWNVADGSAFTGSSSEYYRFLKSKSGILNGASTSITSLNNNVNTYITANGTKAINVVGYYRSDETNDNSFYANLGLSRANVVKQDLIKLGIPAKNITTSSQLLEGEFMNGDTLMKGCDYTFSTIEDNSTKLSDIKSRLQANPIILYFQTNSNNLDLSDSQKQQFSDLIYYLDNVADAKVNVSGHTDNVGNPAANRKLSEERAA